MKWREEYKVHYYYTDFRGRLKPSYIGRYMQETANYGLKHFGISTDFMIENNYAFILSKIRFEYYAPVFEDEVIQVETWALPPKSTAFHRNYRISRNGTAVAAAISVWALINTKEKSIMRPENFKYMTLDMTDTEELPIQIQRRLKAPEDIDIKSLPDYAIKYSDIDHNMHMNNTLYIDLICDCVYDYIPRERLDGSGDKNIASINSIDISYNSEAVFGDTLEIAKGIALADKAGSRGFDAEHYIKAKNKSSGLNCFDAKVSVSEGLRLS